MTREMPQPGRPMHVPATAAGQALGYSLQFTRLTAMLLDAAAGSTCSLEVLDDVAEQTADGRIKVGQAKSALTTNPVADRAIPLWKTLFNWLELVRGGHVESSKTVFELYVSRQVEGELITSFHDARSPEEAMSAIRKARERMWGDPPGFIKKRDLPEALGRYVNAVFEAEEDVLVPVIINLRLERGSGSPQEDIEAAILRGPVSEAKVSDIADKMCGWVKRQVDKLLEKGMPAFIARDEFHREYVSYVRRVDRDAILTSFARKPSAEEQKERLPDVFVQQLDFIEFGFDDKLDAISDFLRSCWDRAFWSKSGDVHEDSFSELDENLLRTWRNVSRETGIEASSRPPVERGKLLHAGCMGHQAKVQGMEPPSHFIPGCFQRLADEKVIGWHPEYIDLLKKAAGGT